MALSKNLKRQIKISVWIILGYFLALFIYLKSDVNEGAQGGEGDEGAESIPYSELTWEILVVEPSLQSKLWTRFDNSPQGEKEKAFLAVIHMLDSLTKEQAEHLAKNFLERSGVSPNRNHRKKVLEMMERLGAKFINALVQISHFSAQAENAPLENQQRRSDVKEMMANIAREIRDSGYKYCMRGTDQEIRRCAESLVSEGHANSEKHLREFIVESDKQQRNIVLLVVSKNRLGFGKEYVKELLDSPDIQSIRTGVRLVREYELQNYKREVSSLPEKLKNISSDSDQSLGGSDESKEVELLQSEIKLTIEKL